ncbi:hypothetical protein IQ247_06005 [Plectonema cf. radiosum LEGE 06105]|uniref:Uncharacterized protein n=1 Tax=Plectonema cf. radiosum LEGE 06105 TaxID=945769 RepID=A0A8J7JZC6_9CYAN|nr:hypothetical protein [Plectonema radiosum]MBE9212266.1 hypothetical protein [Plectonema cf. radiosum LEGE 06105]
MNFLIAVLSNRFQVEAAYTALEKENFSQEQISILGEGYKSADEFGLIQPNKQAGKQSKKLIYWVIPFGFVAGYAFNLLTGIEIFNWAGAIGNHIIGGILGAASGALGAILVGGAVGWTVGSGDALAYRNRLNAGKYLIVFKGTEAQIREATRVIRQFEPENIQGYKEPVSA